MEVLLVQKLTLHSVMAGRKINVEVINGEVDKKN